MHPWHRTCTRILGPVATLLPMPMPLAPALLITLLTVAPGWSRQASAQQAPHPVRADPQSAYVGFDRNLYPGDDALPTLRRHFDFAGFWLNNPPGESRNTWQGKREVLLRSGFGFLVLANGRLDKEILAQSRAGATAESLGERDAAAAVVAARRERFPARTILFLDQEEGGRLLPEQAAYLLAWTEAVAATGFRPGVYASGQPVGDGPGQTITTAQDITRQVAAHHLHPVALWVAQDACPPAPGCTLNSPALSVSRTPDALVWQYAQSPRRPSITAACARTYASDGNCYASGPEPVLKTLYLDLSVSSSPDPSNGR